MAENYEFAPIETVDKIERAEILEKELLKIQILAGKFAFEKARAEGRKVSFSEAFDSVSNILLRFHESLKKEKGDIEAEKIFNEYKVKIDVAFSDNQDDWLAKTMEVFEDLDKHWNHDWEKAGHNERLGFGSIYYDFHPCSKEFESVGLNQEDEILEIHLDEFYKREENSDIKKSLAADLSKLAVAIIDKMSQVKAITAFSWLMSHPAAKEMGFRIFEGAVEGSRGGSTWLQFVDRNGNIHQQRLQKFLETGEVPFKAKFGFIPVIDFLQKFLPADRRGQITLYETRSGWRETQEKIDDFFREIKNFWADMSFEELKNFLVRNESVLKLFEEMSIRDRFIEVLIEAKRTNKNLKETGVSLASFITQKKISDFFSRGLKYSVQID